MISRTSIKKVISRTSFTAHTRFSIFHSLFCTSSHHKLLTTHKEWLSPNQVLKILDTIDDPPSITSFLNDYSKRKDYKPTESLFKLVIHKLAFANKFDEIDLVMRRIKLERPYRLTDDFFFDIIKVYGNVGGRIRRAIEVLFDMPSFGCWPSVRTFNFVLNLLVNAKLFDVVHEVYMGAPKLGVEIDSCCLNIVIKGLCVSGNMEAAFYVLDEFPKQKCKPNVRTYSTLMRALCENGKVEEAIKLLDRMEMEGIDADTITFNILISGFRKQGRVEEGKGILNRMRVKGCEPDAGSYHEVLYGLLGARKFVEAKELMMNMISMKASPSFESYNKLIHGLCEENMLSDIDWALKQMVKQGFVPKMGIWKHMLQTVLSSNQAVNSILIKDSFDVIIV